MKTSSWITVEQARAALTTGTGKGIKIAVIDSGIEVTHPDLNGLQLTDDIHVIGSDLQLVIRPGDGSDLFGHGTAVAAIIRSLASEAEIGSFRVLNENNASRTDVICEGVNLALDHGYKILNCSFGCGVAEHIHRYKAWIDLAYLKGAHVVAACNNYDYTRPEWPGYFPSVITVNYGELKDKEDFYYKPGNLVEFVARGTGFEAAWKGGKRRRMHGSSFAAPHGAAFLARILSIYPDLAPLQAKSLLHQLAKPWDEEAFSTLLAPSVPR
jgi:subtilisin family serine protease